jgi:hypothetical protein
MRARQYLEYAEDARRSARACTGEMREHYLYLAEQWVRLAADVAEYAERRPDTK